MRGILYVRFAEKARPVRAVIPSLTGVLGATRLRSHPNPKVSLTAAGRLNLTSLLFALWGSVLDRWWCSFPLVPLRKRYNVLDDWDGVKRVGA